MNRMNALYISDGFAAHEQAQGFKALHGLKKPILERFESMEILLRLKDANQEHFLTVHSLPLKLFSLFSLEPEFVRARTGCFPLPFGRGEGQGEGLTRCWVHSCGVRQNHTRPNAPHLDPLPSSDEGRGNPIAAVSRARVWFTEGDRIFPLPFTRGEDQGEGLIRRPFVSLTKWPTSEGKKEKWPLWKILFLIWHRPHRSRAH